MCTFSGVKPAMNVWICALATDRDLESGLSKEHKCQDPKDGELCLRRAKSRETLAEARAILTCKSFVILGLWGPKTNRTI